mmetsp:Transcript_48313/g.105170  ORF Transcript_48313/g.105170 Transcript_48313/m.105170 type:complete len:93 (+) Transcript_48313:65-343(+)|eukprot:CAMPEP_0204253100 /NCGR_PEP_ID=MMETSP0468-20130131/1672_1 /ASSEMBLY_ACC=CAM_ASM_000383 /TAXON_ID=2969 /ORGANISM="Oxyrrhis marina" /LENGTH=92 /DNA_ID=CAMNT_0051226637 /DNA_START=63 /DNA_END=341 /DNA_ORIENTATION=+
MGFWDTGMNTPGTRRIWKKRWGMFYVWGMFSVPTALVWGCNQPWVLKLFNDKYQPLVYPARSDPAIIADVMEGRQPRKTSMDSYAAEGRRVI